MRRRRDAFLQENNISYLNVVKAGQFNFPTPAGGWANNNGLQDVIPVIRGDENLFFALRGTNTSFDVLVYEYTGVDDYVRVIKSASDLTFRANLGSVIFTHETVEQSPVSIQYVKIGGDEYLYVLTKQSKIAVFLINLDLDSDPAVASLDFVDSYAVQHTSIGNPQCMWFSEDYTNLYYGDTGGNRIVHYTLSTPADLSTLSLVEQTTVLAAGRPTFFGGGTYALCKYRLGDGQSDLANYECSTPYDITTATLRYRRPLSKVNANLRATLTLPIIMSNNRRECNWFVGGTGSNNAGGRIGYGWFDIPFNFRGESQTAEYGVRGVRFTDGTFVEP